MAGLQEGVAQNMQVNCAGGGGLYGFFHPCDEHHGVVDIHTAIPFSCDTFFYTLGDRLGIDSIAKYATALGYGQKTGIDLPNEQAGLMPSSQWKMKNYHKRWYPDETLDVGIGQGAVEATPLQLARIIGGIASGGHLVRPHVVFPDQLPADFRKALLDSFPGSGDVNVPIDPDNWIIITDGMAEATQPGAFHTAGSAHLEGIDFAGKTGTAQVMSHEALGKTAKGKSTYPNVWFVGVDAAAQPRVGGCRAVGARRVQLLPGAHRGQGGLGLREKAAQPGPQPGRAGQDQCAGGDERGCGRFPATAAGASIQSPGSNATADRVQTGSFLIDHGGQIVAKTAPNPSKVPAKGAPFQSKGNAPSIAATGKGR